MLSRGREVGGKTPLLVVLTLLLCSSLLRPDMSSTGLNQSYNQKYTAVSYVMNKSERYVDAKHSADKID